MKALAPHWIKRDLLGASLCLSKIQPLQRLFKALQTFIDDFAGVGRAQEPIVVRVQVEPVLSGGGAQGLLLAKGVVVGDAYIRHRRGARGLQGESIAQSEIKHAFDQLRAAAL
jgi:hypothetical protein